MSNEHHDLAALCGSGIGIDALQVRPVDEVLADVPFSEWDVEMGGLGVGETWRGGDGEGVGRDALLLAVTTQCFEGRPSLLEAGLRFCAMASRAGVPVALNANERRQLRAVTSACNGALWLPRCEAAGCVFEFLQGAESEPRMIGRRLSLMAYAFNRGPVIREVMPSLESIGVLWGLRAENKRSAVSAAMRKLRDEVRRGGWMTQHRRLESFQFWFEKSPDARAVYAAAQVGNANRNGGAEDAAEDVEMLQGIPLRPEWRGLSAGEMRRRLDALARGKSEN